MSSSEVEIEMEQVPLNSSDSGLSDVSSISPENHRTDSNDENQNKPLGKDTNDCGFCRSSSAATTQSCKEHRWLKLKCIIFGLAVCLFLFLICSLAVLSLLLYKEKEESNMLMNELFALGKQLECYNRNAENGLCPKRIFLASKCRRVISIECDNSLSG